MKNIVTKCLVMGALAIGMSSTVMADKNSSPDAQCNNSTLKGRYLVATTSSGNSLAGELYFYGDGTGRYNVTIKQYPSKNKPDNNISDLFTYTKEGFGDCHFLMTTHPLEAHLDLYASMAGDTIAVVDGDDGELTSTTAYYIYRDKQTTVRHK